MREEALALQYIPSRSINAELARAQRVDIDDDGAAQILVVLGEERMHAAVLRQLGAQRDEPHLGIRCRGCGTGISP